MESSTLRESLLDAMHRSDVDSMRPLLLSCTIGDLQAASLSLEQILTAATLCSRLDLIKTCLEAGAAVEKLTDIDLMQRVRVVGVVARIAIRENNMALLGTCLDDTCSITHFGRDAAYYGSIQAFKFLISAGLDINAAYGHVGDALICAIRTDQLSMAEFLLDNGASLGYEHFLHGILTPLALAAQSSSPEMVKLLLSRGAPIPYSLALHRAAYAGRVGVMRILLDVGADMNENPTADHEWTWSMAESLGPPLHFAADNRQISAIECLLDLGADPALRDFQGKNLIQRSAKDGKIWEQLDELLRERHIHLI